MTGNNAVDSLEFISTPPVGFISLSLTVIEPDLLWNMSPSR